MNRHGTLKDIRSRIKHENTNLGSGTEAGAPRPFNMPDNFNPAIVPPSRLQQPNVGAGPSFVSLAPSDSVSNFEGRAGHGHQPEMMSSYPSHRPSSPTNLSTASFALATDASPNIPPAPGSPLRPARSVRRPQQAPAVDRLERSKTSIRPSLKIPPIPAGAPLDSSSVPSPISPSRAGPGRDLLAASRSQQQLQQQQQQHSSPPSNRHTRSAQLMAQVAQSGRDTPISSADEEDDIYGGISPVDEPQSRRSQRVSFLGQQNQPAQHQKQAQPTVGLGSLTQSDEPAALSSVLSALSAAGRKHQAARIMRGTTAEEETRRRKTERKISEVQTNRRRPVEEYVKSSDERAFREINAVLRKVRAEWPFVADDDFNSVALALSMLDQSSLGSSRYEFQEMKQLIERGLQGTVDDHHESFATAITLHNSVLLSLTAAQNSVSSARRRLRVSRETLGAKRADLVQMWQRVQAVKESLRLLDLVEHLKGVPDRLESLMAEKRFLHAVNLLVRSLKTIEKPEIVEVGATSDLRAYLKGQEQAMLEILIEELHNHLYLKSYFCDARWKSYNAGQEELPLVDFGSDYKTLTADQDAEHQSPTPDGSNANGSAKKTLKLQRYLQSLSARPTFDPNLASNIPDAGLDPSQSLSALTGELASNAIGTSNGHGDKGSHSISQSLESSISAAGENGLETYGIDVGAAEFEQNPEADSFLYIEMLLESLARLGKLGVALDTISQRLTIEVHQLVDATIDEVDARNEPLRGFSAAMRPESILLASSSALAKSFSESIRSSRSSFNMGNRPVSSMFRISAGESSALQRDGETMRDLFWTLFSKLDAVLQGHRVVYEVAGMIAGRAGFKDALATRKLSGVASLVEVWKPIQTEVRTLLHDYLMDDEQSTNSRTAIISVNDVLRDARFGRDRSKQLFKLGDSDLRTTRKKGNALLRRHEEALTAALRASVPGLVSTTEASGTMAGSASASVPARANQVIVSSTRSDETYTGAGHRLLVKPDAFNVSVLFQPALSFIERVQQVMPTEAAGETSKGFGAFLDEFVQDVFLPQLEDKVQSLFQSATGGADAFQEDPASRQTETRPVVKSVTNIIVLIDSLYSMLRTTPFHRESYSRLIITTIVQYYQRCNERFRDLVTLVSGASSGPGGSGSGSAGASSTANGSTAEYTLSATWAQRPEIYACLVEQKTASSSEDRAELEAQENRFQLALADARPPILLHELTTSRKKLLALASLQHSLQWFVANIARLQPQPADTEGADGIPRSKRAEARLSIIHARAAADGAEEEVLKLPLSRDMAARYAALPGVYTHLSNVLLFTLRHEVRARVLHHLALAIEGSYVVSDSSVEPSPHVVDLNADLAHLDDIFSSTLPASDVQFLFAGLASFMDTLLVRSARSMRALNTHGLSKMIRNILALQQNLKNILTHPLAVHFDKSRKFWELLSARTPQAFLKAIEATPRHLKLQYEDYRAALHLALGIENPASAMGATPSAMPITPVPGAGTFADKSGAEISRQKYNEYRESTPHLALL